MIVLIGHFRLPADKVEAARAPIAKVVTGTRAEAGCIKYAFAPEPGDPGLFHVSEVWDSQAALDAHFASAHMKQWQADRAELGMSEREITAYTVSGSKTL
jgi:quinol monooxygenase YgiN